MKNLNTYWKSENEKNIDMPKIENIKLKKWKCENMKKMQKKKKIKLIKWKIIKVKKWKGKNVKNAGLKI